MAEGCHWKSFRWSTKGKPISSQADLKVSLGVDGGEGSGSFLLNSTKYEKYHDHVGRFYSRHTGNEKYRKPGYFSSAADV